MTFGPSEYTSYKRINISTAQALTLGCYSLSLAQRDVMITPHTYPILSQQIRDVARAWDHRGRGL
jgi:hypothetical protein